MPIVAWYWLSNESYMNLVIKEVLPTRPQSYQSKPRYLALGISMRESCAYRSVRPEKQVYVRVVSVLSPSYSTQGKSVCLLEFLERIRIRSYSRLCRHDSIERAQEEGRREGDEDAGRYLQGRENG